MNSGTWSFTKVLVADLETEVAFYRDVFGLEEAHRMKAGLDSDPAEEVFFATHQGYPVLGLVTYLHRQPPPVGETIIGISVPDIRAAFERAKHCGGKVAREPTTSEQTHGYTIGLLEDPEGHIIEVLEAKS